MGRSRFRKSRENGLFRRAAESLEDLASGLVAGIVWFDRQHLVELLLRQLVPSGSIVQICQEIMCLISLLGFWGRFDDRLSFAARSLQIAKGTGHGTPVKRRSPMLAYSVAKFEPLWESKSVFKSDSRGTALRQIEKVKKRTNAVLKSITTIEEECSRFSDP